MFMIANSEKLKDVFKSYSFEICLQEKKIYIKTVSLTIPSIFINGRRENKY